MSPRVSVWLAFCLILLAPTASARSADEYIFILGARGNTYWTLISEGIRDEAKKKGVDAVIYETDSDTDAEAQLNICLTAVQRKPKVLVMQSITPAIGIQCFRQAAAAGIAVADIDAHLTVDEAAQAGVTLAFTIGSDNSFIGREAAHYAAKIAGKPDPKILIIEGAPGNLTSEKRVSGFRDGLKDTLPSAHIVASIASNWDRLKAMTITADTLQRQPDLDMIYTAADVMALGAAEALRNAKNASVKIISVDGSSDGRKAVKDGRVSATVAQLPYLMGMKAVDLAYETTHGQKISQTNITPTPVLDRTTLQANQDPLLKYVR